MVAFNDELISFRDVRRMASNLDQIFKKCPTCGKERRIPDMVDYPFKLRSNGKSYVFFCKESCMRKYIAAHPELIKDSNGPRTWSAKRYRATALKRAERAKKYIAMFDKGLTYTEIAKKCNVFKQSVIDAINKYNDDVAKGIL